MQILHLEDSAADAELLHNLLHLRWPEASIRAVDSKAEFESSVLQGNFDLIISDYSLPAYDGLTALKFARTHRPEKPFIYVSGTIGEERAIQALRSGATDYIIKDRPGRLIPAIEDALERCEEAKAKRSVERKMAQQAALLGKAREAICAIGPDCCITFWNASAERLYGFDAEAVIGRDLRQVLYREHFGPFDAAYAAVLEKGEWRGELQPSNSRNELLIVESFWSLVVDERSQTSSILIVEADISQKKRMEAQLMQNQRLETLGLLAGGIAHDLNNVLSPIIHSVHRLSQGATRPEDLDLIETLDVSAQHGVDLVRQLMAFARGSVGRITPVPPSILIAGACRLVRHAMPAHITVSTAVEDCLPVLHVDPTQLRQVLLNLCINARDAMPDGGTIEIRAEARDVRTGASSIFGEVRPGRYICVSVSDSGSGIPPELFGKLFDPFFTTKKEGKGTGLGLANVAGIVKAHGGFIDLESTFGKGTRFSIHLPILEHAVSGDVERATPGELPRAKGTERILVIDDDEGVRRIVKLMLGDGGFASSVAKSGTEGVQMLRAEPGHFSLVITDLNMPGLSGSKLLRELKAVPSPVPIIVLSGMPEVLKDIGDVEVLSKPVGPNVLVATVRRVIDEARRKSALGAA